MAAREDDVKDLGEISVCDEVVVDKRFQEIEEGLTRLFCCQEVSLVYEDCDQWMYSFVLVFFG